MNAGDQLGPYKIIEQLGVGGMGEVYLGEDTRLGRKVAIKVLPAEFAGDPERLARFEQEARAAAALNHPHIAAVFDVGAEVVEGRVAGDGTTTHFIVQEYLEGEALDATLAQGALSFKKAVNVATEVAEALAVAHRAGIVHRDLKPANVFITRDGHAKVLDFGLAKLTEAAVGAADMSMSPTMLGTMAGQVMGTPGYMAPEQVEGKTVDHRADIFAFGCLLYEMMVGAKAFGGQSVPDTLAKILHEDPAELVQPTGKMPDELARIARKCLAKEPESRYQHADDLVVDVRAAAPDQTTAPAGAMDPAAQPASSAAATAGGSEATAAAARPTALPWAIAAIAIVIAIAIGAWALRPSGSTGTEIVRFSIDRGELETSNYLSPPFAVSPDGRTIVYVAASGDGEQLFRRRVDELEGTPIPDSLGARGPFFSPDGNHIGFFGDGELKRVAVAGGQPTTVCQVASVNGSAVWTEDDQIIFGLRAVNSGLLEVSAGGGVPAPLTTLDTGSGESQHASPQLWPGGRVSFDAYSPSGRELQVVARASGEVTTVGPVGRYHAGTQQLLFVDGQQLFAQPFDVDRLSLSGTRVQLLDGVIHVAFSAGGTLLYSDGVDPAVGMAIVKIDRRGRVEELPGLLLGDFTLPVLSPDGTRLAFTEGWIAGSTATSFIGLYDLERGALTRHVVDGFGAQWGADSQSIVFSSGNTLRWQPLENAETLRELVSGTEGSLWTTDVSPNGRVIAYYEIHPDTGRDIWTVEIDGDTEPVPFLVTAASERSAVFSPDGHWIAYMSDAGGQEEVYVRPFPAGGAEIQVSIGGGREPRWSADGTEIFYRQGRGMYAVSVTTKPEFRVGDPDLLFQGVFLVQPGGRNATYDVDADGNFYMTLRPEGGERVNVVLNWDRELERLLAGQR